MSSEMESLRDGVPWLESMEELERRLEMQALPFFSDWCVAYDCQGDCGGGELCATHCTCKGEMCECMQEHCYDLCGADHT
ncbi:MAG: hypothetical protein AB1640_04190 [bacterium]